MSSARDEEDNRRNRRAALKRLNETPRPGPGRALDSSLKRHTALIKRMKQSMGNDTKESNLKDIDGLTLEKYVEEIAAASVDGAGRCKTEKDIWSATEVISAIHQRFPSTFTPALLAALEQNLAPPVKQTLASLPQDQREKEENARVSRQRPLLRLSAELAMVGVWRDAPDKSGGETIMKIMKELLVNDAQLGSLPLLITFLKSYARPYLGIVHHSQGTDSDEAQSLSSGPKKALPDGESKSISVDENQDLIEKSVRDRFKKLCDTYYGNVAKKLVREHVRLQDQDQRNHEAYIKSGEIFEDRQQAYEKLARSHERLMTSCQALSELLVTPMPELPKAPANKSLGDSMVISLDTSSSLGRPVEEWVAGGKWEDEEERRFYEELSDLKDYVPRSVLGIEANESSPSTIDEGPTREALDVKDIEEEMQRLGAKPEDITAAAGESMDDDDDTPVPTPPRTPSPQPSVVSGQGPHQILTALLAKLSDATNKELIDEAAIQFASLNSKAARNRLVKHLTQVPKHRTDLLPYMARLVATLAPYMHDVPTDLIAFLEDQFKYLQKKKRVIKELADLRRWNIAYISCLTKFSLLPNHIILHMYKVFVDDFSGVNIDNIATFLEGCGRFLMRDEKTGPRMTAMVELMRRKQSLSLLDQRQRLLLENAYYMCNPPERGPRQEKHRSPMELFVNHLIYDVLSKKTIDRVLKLIRKLDWESDEVRRTLRKAFTRPWKVKYASISLLAMLVYDLHRYHASFAVSVVDQALEDMQRGMELNLYKNNQRRVATIKYIGELYIYRMISSSVVFATLWNLISFGHPNGRSLPSQHCPIDVPDDFFRIRLVCALIDSCGMCFDKGSLRKKLDAFITFFFVYIKTKAELPMDVMFMINDTLENVRPQFSIPDNYEAAVAAADLLISNRHLNEGDDGDESDAMDDEDGGYRPSDKEEEDERASDDDVPRSRPVSPDAAVVLSHKLEFVGPSEEEDDQFNKELARMMLDSSQEARRVDQKAASVMWETAVMPGGRKRKDDSETSDPDEESNRTMKFTLLSRRGKKQMTKKLAVPDTAPIAIHTKNAQLQDKVEQQHLKKLVLDYESREEQEEYRQTIETLRQRGIKVRYAKE